MIKFRAWDKRRKEMWKVATLHIEDEYADLFKTNIYEKPFDNPWAKFEDLILMQSTDLKDKNGVEIFERDVLKRKVHVVLLGTDLDEWVEETYLVEWKYGGWHIGEDLLAFVLESGFDRHTGCYQTALEVIGNIHANPELLS